MLLDLVEDEVDKELARFDPVEIDPGDPVDPPERVEDPRLEELVVLRQIDALGGDFGTLRRAQIEATVTEDITGRERRSSISGFQKNVPDMPSARGIPMRRLHRGRIGPTWDLLMWIRWTTR